MPAVCLYFQVHQPHRLRRYSVFDADARYFDEQANAQVLRKVAAKCYDPATALLLQLIERHGGDFRLAFSLTGSVLDQFERYAPELIERFAALAQTGCVEFLAETYEHSLAFLYSPAEFDDQVALHAERIDALFGQRPVVFRNSELIYSNQLAVHLAKTGRYQGVLAEGVDHLLAGRSPNHVYHPPGVPDLGVLLKNYRLSDDIAFRFSDPHWSDYPLTADRYADWLTKSPGQVVGLFMDFETVGEHQWAETGIFEFLRRLPAATIERGGAFLTPSEALDEFEPVGVFDAPRGVSWADSERDLSAWMGNAMQTSALAELYKLEPAIKAAHAAGGDPTLLRDWRRLGCSDHFYYMCTKYFADGEVHRYFSPYESPYDSYINFMNVLDHLRSRAETAAHHAGG
jgi:alpha-amylase